MNLHGYLAKNKIGYESEEAKDFANIFFMMMNFYSIERSMEIAKERGINIRLRKFYYANDILVQCNLLTQSMLIIQWYGYSYF